MELTEGLFWYREKMSFGDCNKYVVKGEFLVLVDTGNPRSVKVLLKELKDDGLDASDIRLVVNTHCHPDHCGANGELRELTGARFIVHPAELGHVKEYRAIGELLAMNRWEPEAKFEWKDEVANGDITLRMLHTPGHSAGSISIYCPQKRFLACGDLVFDGGVGRTDLPGGNDHKLMESLEMISELPLEYLLPGHGDVLKGVDDILRNFEFVKSTFFQSG
jgi:glyoxylase-like metal-dependent hydrolase (beta-lactamase superfamily II)